MDVAVALVRRVKAGVRKRSNPPGRGTRPVQIDGSVKDGKG